MFSNYDFSVVVCQCERLLFFKADVKVNSDLKHAKETLQAEEKKKKEINRNISDVSNPPSSVTHTIILLYTRLQSVIEQWQLFCFVVKMHLHFKCWLSCHF